jgi:hypothetical protein
MNRRRLLLATGALIGFTAAAGLAVALLVLLGHELDDSAVQHHDEQIAGEAKPERKRPSRPATEDEKLVASVRRAAERRLRPDEVEKFVGRKATFNTTRPQDARAARDGYHVGADPDGHWSDARVLRDRPAVVWQRPLSTRRGYRIVGIEWQPGGAAEVFFGAVRSDD